MLKPNVGVAYFINRNVLLSAELGYGIIHSEFEALQQISPTNFSIETFKMDNRNASLEISTSIVNFILQLFAVFGHESEVVYKVDSHGDSIRIDEINTGFVNTQVDSAKVSEVNAR
ncbi:hypothetical protein [Larkinella rosea]|uniref:hypothetical protein n=1 Tax=Larkinella rosea TaxID=2025312 RepID=UPI001C89F69F|nr:hypothetical protein [Larkinella rosea]